MQYALKTIACHKTKKMKLQKEIYCKPGIVSNFKVEVILSCWLILILYFNKSIDLRVTLIIEHFFAIIALYFHQI